MKTYTIIAALLISAAAVAQMYNKIYSVERSGDFYETNTTTGTWKKVSNTSYVNTSFIFAGSSLIYTIENSGSLYATDPETGSWKQLEKPDFAATVFMTASSKKLYTIETSGSLYEIDVD